MKLYPAIDLYDGKAVRLFQGDYDRMTVYSNDPAALVRDFASQGAECLHLVDLEGARDGTVPHMELVSRMVRESGLFTEIGGGVRTRETAERYLDAGVDRVILGTAAVTDRPLLTGLVRDFGDRIAVGVDVRDGMVAIRGWTESSRYSCFEFCAEMEQLGVSAIICTDISRDGAMKGANRELYRELTGRFSPEIIASGGVSSLEDIRELKKLGLAGAILGKAYYTGAVDLREALEAAK